MLGVVLFDRETSFGAATRPSWRQPPRDRALLAQSPVRALDGLARHGVGSAWQGSGLLIPVPAPPVPPGQRHNVSA